MPPAPFDGARVRRALTRVLRATMGGRERDALYAWLCAFRHHWPRRYAREIAELGDALAARLGPSEECRYLKLRRIALENLAGIL